MTTVDNGYKDACVLVTGGAGFIGSHLVERLCEEGANVTVVDDVSTGRRENLLAVARQFSFIRGDLGYLLKSGIVKPSRYDYIFHLAGNSYVPWSVEDPEKDYRSNLFHTFLLLEAMRDTPNLPRLVNVSSAAVYGDPRRFPIRETSRTVPLSPYGVSKLAAERYVDVYSRIYGLPGASVRLFSVYGPRQRKQVVYDLLQKLRFDPTRLEVLGDGSQARDFVYVHDVVAALLQVGSLADCRGEVYNVASGTTYTIDWLVRTLCHVCGLQPEIVYSGAIRAGDAQEWRVNIDRLLQLGDMDFVRLKTGLRDVVEWYDDI